MSHSAETSGSDPTEKEIFLTADEIDDPAEREAFLKKVCGEDKNQFDRLCRMLDHEAQAPDSLDPERYPALVEARNEVSQELVSEENFSADLGMRIRYLGDYELVEEVGRGAMGVVYRANQRSLNRSVALKVILGQSMVADTDRDRFRIEAEAAARLDHPNVVPIYEIGEHDGFDFYSMKFVSGGTLNGLMPELGKHIRRGVELMRKVVNAVQAAHDHGILHRDLKPENVLIDDYGEPQVSDFGIACRTEQDSRLTLTGQIMGTPRYMSPEQAAGEEVTVSADVYSLGAILYEMSCGEPLFKGDSVYKILQLVQGELPRSPRSLRPDLDRDLETIILKCLEKDPERRYRSARAFADDLGAWLEHRPIAARPPTSTERIRLWCKRRPVHAVLVFGSLLLMLALGIGGPIVAFNQSQLRADADLARGLSEIDTAAAEKARGIAETARDNYKEEVRKNRQLLYYADMEVGGFAVGEPGMLPNLGEILEKWKPAEGGGEDLRGWEWYFLSSARDQASIELLSTREELRQRADARPISAVRFHPSSDAVLLARRKLHGLEVHGLGEKRIMRRIGTRTGNTHAFWNPDGSKVATSAPTGISIYNEKGERVAHIDNPHLFSHFREAPAIAWSGDGARLASAGTDLKIKIWDARDFDLLETHDIFPEGFAPKGEFFDPFEVPRRFLWTKDGAAFVLTGHARDDSNYIYVRRPGDSERPLIRIRAHETAIQDIALSPDGTRLLSGSGDKTAKIWNLDGRGKPMVLKGHKGWVMAVAWSATGNFVVSGSNNREVFVWDVRDPQNPLIRDVMSGHTAGITSVDWSPDGLSIATSDKAGETRIWRRDRRKASRFIFYAPGGASAAEWVKGGKAIAILHSDSRVQIISPHDGDYIGDGFRTGSQEFARNGVAIGQGDKLAFQINYHGIGIADLAKRSVSNIFYTPNFARIPIIDFAWDPSGERLAVAYYQGDLLRIIDLAEGKFLDPFPKADRQRALLSVSWSPDGMLIAASGKSSNIQLWDADSASLVADNPDRDSEKWYIDHAWSPDSTRIATGSITSEITIWKVEGLEVERELIGHTSEVRSVAWHPGGKRLASASGDHTIRIWDVDTGESIITFRAHSDAVKSVAWSPDGQMLLSLGMDGQIRVWDATRAYEKESGG